MNTLASLSTVVTGAAKGIGAAIARRYALEGASVVIADVDLAAAEALRDELLVQGATAIAVEMDVTDRGAVRAGLAAALDQFGRLDVMVNNAGISLSTTLFDTSQEIWMRHQEVNGLGTLIGMQEAAKRMIERGAPGKIINVTSISGRRNNADWVAYAASKAVTSSLIQSGARALAPYGITVTGIAPGIVATPLWDGVDAEATSREATSREARLARYASQIPLGYVSAAEDLAGAAVFLAGGDSRYMTGQVITVDGGITA